MLAAGKGHNECVSILVANGADVNIATKVAACWVVACIEACILLEGILDVDIIYHSMW